MKWLKRLWFKYKYWRAPYIVSVDWGSKDYTAEIWAKYVDGVLYIEKEKLTHQKEQVE